MSFLSIALLLTACVASATADIIYDVDWVTAARMNTSIPITGPDEFSDNILKSSTGYRSQFGVFRHWSCGKYIHTRLNPPQYCPSDFVQLNIWTTIRNDGAMYFRFVQVIGHYGYLEHTCGKVVHPRWGSMNPADDTNVYVHRDRHAGVLWTIDEENMAVLHRSGKRLYPRGGSPNPGLNTDIVVHSARNDASRFQFVNPRNGKPIRIFPTPKLSGHWRIIYAVINPRASHTYQITYTIGKSVSKSAYSSHEWKVSASVSFLWFKASTEYRQFAEKTESSTWSSETRRTYTIRVTAGKTVVAWQYFFEAEQFGDGLSFRSTILADTDSVNNKPKSL